MIPIEEEKILKKIYLKEPEHDAQLHEVSNLEVSYSIQLLKEQASRFTNISLENLYLIFSGRVMKSSGVLKDYGVVENSIVYAVNGSKYLRTVNK